MMTAFLITLIKIALVLACMFLSAALSVWVERRVSALIQDRYGPNRVGPFGLFQIIADMVKLITKEDIVPRAANRFVHDFAPMISLGIAVITFAVIPFGNTIDLFGQHIKLIIADVNVGVLYILGMTSMGVYGLTLAGWSSNNKYSLLGGLRSSAQMISYELTMGLSLIGVVLISGTVRLDEIVLHQAQYIGGILPMWNAVLQPVGFITFFVAAFAETNRLPFDLPEAEPELVGGYHTEYTGMKFGMFMFSEYLNMITSSALITTLFLGGWHLPFAETWGLEPLTLSIVQILTFVVKVVLVILFFILVRWTIPRFRYDQLMRLGWKWMLPLTIANLVITAVVVLLI